MEKFGITKFAVCIISLTLLGLTYFNGKQQGNNLFLLMLILYMVVMGLFAGRNHIMAGSSAMLMLQHSQYRGKSAIEELSAILRGFSWLHVVHV